MRHLSASVEEGLAEEVEGWAEEHTDGNRSEAVRELLRRGLRYDRELEQREARIQELENQLRARQDREQDVGELVEYVEEEQSWRRAGITTRAKWWLFGKDDDRDEE